MILNIGIIGVGGVGGYFGGKLCRAAAAQGAKVYFVARGPHLDAIRRNGLSVKTAAEGEWICRPTSATDAIEDLPVLDLCLVCVKSYDLPEVVRQLQHSVSPTTAVLPLLNGIDIYERIRAELDTAHIFPACAYIGVHIEAPGVIAQQGGACKILFGMDPRAAGVVPQHLFELFDRSDIRYEWLDDVSPALWMKYIFIAAYGLVGASFDKTLGEMLESDRLTGYVRAVMREITLLAEKKGIPLPEGAIVESYRKARDFPCETKTSFQRDFERAEKPDERDLFGGAILRLGKQVGVATPVTQELWEVMEERKPWP